jgi:hypothetical protein
MGGKGQGKAGRRAGHLCVRCGCRRVFLIRCYTKNVKSDLTADEKKELRKIAANLKGSQ